MSNNSRKFKLHQPNDGHCGLDVEFFQNGESVSTQMFSPEISVGEMANEIRKFMNAS